MDLAHPRVQYTRESLEKAKAKLAANVRWARLVYDDLIRQADGFQFTRNRFTSICRLSMPTSSIRTP